MMSLRDRWNAVPKGDPRHDKCRLVVEAIANRGGEAWARDIGDDFDLKPVTIRPILMHLNWHGVLLWVGTARILQWEGERARSSETDQGHCPLRREQEVSVAICIECRGSGVVR